MSILNSLVPKSLQSKVNSADNAGELTLKEGVIGELLPELTLDLPDEELIERKKMWESKWSSETKKLEKWRKQNEEYWLGRYTDPVMQETETKDNRLFAATETFLPLATQQNPEPVVDGDGSPGGLALAETVQKMCVSQADRQRLKLKIKAVARHWVLFHLGAVKVGWDHDTDDIQTTTILPQKLILDPDATIEEGVDYNGEYIGEVRTATASRLIERFERKQKYISEMVKGKLGTKLNYTEWWTNEFVFWTLKDEVLGKIRNPHWNYEDTEVRIDEFGNEFEETVPGLNHFQSKQMPYILLSIFNVGRHPWDETSLYQQNIGLQDQINRRMQQIDDNVRSQNNGLIVSGDSFTKEQAANASRVLKNGGAIWVPRGDVNRAVRRDSAPSLSPDIFNNLTDARNELDNLFGTHAGTRGESTGQETARGRILLKESDSSRIGGGVSEYLEQFADKIYNYWVQMMYVYYDEEHTASVVGSEMASEFIKLRSDDFVNVQKLTVSVKEGSLIPKDDFSKRSEAIELYSAGALSILDLYVALKFPDPKGATKRWLYQQTDPSQLIGEQKNPMPQELPPEIPPQGLPSIQPPIAQ